MAKCLSGRGSAPPETPNSYHFTFCAFVHQIAYFIRFRKYIVYIWPLVIISMAANNSELIFRFGPYVPILRTNNGIVIDSKGVADYIYDSISPTNKRLLSEILPDDSIVETPSIVTPLLLKKKTKWPSREVVGLLTNGTTSDEEGCKASNDDLNNQSSSDEVEVIKIVSKSATNVQDSRQRPNHKDAEEYVNSATVASLKNQFQSSTTSSLLTVEDYYRSSVGEMLLGIGLSRVREYTLDSDCKKITNKIRRSREDECFHLKEQLESLRSQLSQARASNKPYKPQHLLKCSHCLFQTEYEVVMYGHMETPHLNKREYMCNWCDYKTKDCNSIGYHTLIQHKKRCRIEKPCALHLCRFCQFECQSKRKITSHLEKCEKVFQHETFLSPKYCEEPGFPAVTSKMITQEDVKTYEQSLKNLRLAAYNPHQLKTSGSQQQSKKRLPILVVSGQNLPSTSTANVTNATSFIQSGAPSSTLDPALGSRRWGAVLGIGPYGKSMSSKKNNHSANLLMNQNNSAQLIDLLSEQNSKSYQNRVGSLHHPRAPQSSFLNGKVAVQTASNVIAAPQKTASTNGLNHSESSIAKSPERQIEEIDIDSSSSSESPSSNRKSSTFVICEICDGFIKDLEQLKSHMQWIHRVKIHHKTLKSTPPLSCQKCQWRFFTDQGLERHLLSSHGLVTSNMQELVDQDKDAGRCTVCGRTFSKLVAHMKETHKYNLKPAHLSYKCTVCSATFNLYRLFENHVYSIHIESVKQVHST